MAREQTNIRLPEELKKQILATRKVPSYCNLSERVIRLLEIALVDEADDKKKYTGPIHFVEKRERVRGQKSA